MNLKMRLLFALSMIFTCMQAIPFGYCESSDISSTLTEWLPIIVQFAMLGMIMGLLKKLGKW